MNDINLYGHLTIDTVLEDDRTFQTLGGLANVWDALIDLDTTCKIGLFPNYIGRAIIYADKKSATRYSRSKMNAQKVKQFSTPAKINHFMYINHLDNLSTIEKLDGIVTADVCLGKPVTIDYLDKIDLLFISDEDVYNLEEIIKTVKGWVVLHHSNGSICFKKDEVFEYNIPTENILKNVNVLGAGDIFSACVLYQLLQNTNLETLPEIVKNAHLLTYKILKEKL